MLTPLNIPSRKRSAPIPHHLLCYGLPRRFAILAMVCLPLATITQAGEPASAARDLQRLIPPDATVVLTVEDLRGQVHKLMASRLATEFLKLPAVKTWFDSEKYEQLETARPDRGAASGQAHRYSRPGSRRCRGDRLATACRRTI